MLKYLYCLPLISPVYADLMRPPTVDAAPDERKKTLILGAAIILDGLVDREAGKAIFPFPFHAFRFGPTSETIPNHGMRAVIILQTCRGSTSALQSRFCKQELLVLAFFFF